MRTAAGEAASQIALRDCSKVAVGKRDIYHNKDLLKSTGNATQYSVIIYMGKNLKKDEYMYVYN